MLGHGIRHGTWTFYDESSQEPHTVTYEFGRAVGAEAPVEVHLENPAPAGLKVWIDSLTMPSSAGCEPILAIKNNSSDRYELITSEVTFYDTTGHVISKAKIGVRQVQPGTTRTGNALLYQTRCSEVARAIFENVMFCKVGGDFQDDCYDRMTVISGSPIPFSK